MMDLSRYGHLFLVLLASTFAKSNDRGHGTNLLVVTGVDGYSQYPESEVIDLDNGKGKETKAVSMSGVK